MAERPEANADRLQSAAQASQQNIWDRSLNIVTESNNRRYRRDYSVPNIRPRPVGPASQNAQRMAIDAARWRGSGYVTSQGVTPLSGQLENEFGADSARWYGGDAAFMGRWRQEIVEGRATISEDGRIVPVQDYLTDEQRADLADPNARAARESGEDGLYPVPGLNAGEFRREDEVEQDEASAALARQDPFQSTSISRAYERARTEAMARNLDLAFRPSRTVFTGDWDDEDVRGRWLMQNYPAVALAAEAEGLDPEDVAKITNLAAARDTAVTIANEPVGVVRQQMWASMSPTQSALVHSIIMDMAEEERRNEAIRKNQGDDPGFLSTVQSFIWGSVGPGTGLDEETGEVTNRFGSAAWLMDMLYEGYEFGQHVGRSLSLELGERDVWGKVGFAASMISPGFAGLPSMTKAVVDRWGETGHGQWDEAGLAELSQKHGEENVTLIKDLLNAKADGSSQAFWNALELVKGDPEKEAFFMQALRGMGDNPQIQQMITEVAAMTNSNLGDIVAREAGWEPGSLPFEVSSDVTNVVGAFALDPLIVASVGGKAIQGARYGLYSLMEMDKGAEAGKFLMRSIKGSESPGIKGAMSRWWYGTANVRRYLNWYGGELEKIRGASGIERGNRTNTLLSQSKRFFDDEALEGMLKAGVKDADSFYDYIQGADDVLAIMRGQGAKRGSQMMIPHMSRATKGVKRFSYSVRGLDPTKQFTARADREMKAIFGDDVADITEEELLRRTARILDDEDATIRLANILGDLRGEEHRSKIAKVIEKRLKKQEFAKTGRVSGAARYGWKRKKAESVYDFLVRWTDRASRLGARFPTKRTLRVATGADSATVYQMMRGAGLSRYWATFFRDAWIQMNPGQRRIAAAGLVRTYGRAAGIHLVDPEAMRYVDDFATGLRKGETYAVPVSEDLIRSGVKDSAVTLDPVNPPTTFDPSVKNGMSSAVWAGQTAEQIALPNFGAIDALRARTNFMGAVLMQNRFGTSVTDWWTLATLAGPRFALRNGIEDAAMYALTSGSAVGWWRGRQISKAIREATPRENKSIAISQSKVAEAEHLLSRAKARGNADDILRAEEELDAANNLLKVDYLRAMKGQKLGFLNTSGRYVGDWLKSHHLGFLNTIMLPHLSRGEIAQAAKAAAAGNRTDLNNLVAKAFIRQKFAFLKDEDSIKLTRAMSEGFDPEDLPEYLRVILRDVDDFVDSPFGMEMLKEASEQTRHLVDGSLAQASNNASVKVVNGQVVARKTEAVMYEGDRVFGTGTPEQVRGVLAQLHFALHTDGPKGQRAMELLENYFQAVALGRTAERERIVRELGAFIGNSTDTTFNYKTMFSLATQDDVDTLARSTLDTLVGLFTKQDGKFNESLYRALKMPSEYKDVPRFKLYFADKDGNTVQNVTVADFATGAQPMPAYATVRRSEGIWVPDGTMLRDDLWEVMGRSLARMTREPIYLSNYLDSRKVMRPLEQRLIAMGENPEVARQRVTNLAAERAYNLTMSYVDNPMIRSRLAWSVRNVARFYRAQEDFIRRMIRMGSNNPMGFWKAAVAWEATQEVGFIHEDQYGQQYFMYPGSGAALNATGRILATITGDNEVVKGTLPLALSGNVQWLTPSADPESWRATFSGPWSGFFLKSALRAMPMFNSALEDLSRGLEKDLLGEISASQGVVSGVLPPNVQKALNSTIVLLGGNPNGWDVTNGSLAGAAIRKTSLAMAAAGYLPTDGVPSPDEVRRLRRVADIQATNAMIVLTLSGTTLPAAPQLTVDDISNFGRELGVQGLRPAFIEMVRKYGFDEAYLRWVADNPEMAIWAESESEPGTLGRWEATTEAAAFAKENRDLMKSSPNGLGYFSPLNGEQSAAAYNYLSSQGLRQKMDPQDYMYNLMKSQHRSEKFILQMWRDQQVAQATSKERIAAIDKVYSRRVALLNDDTPDSSRGDEAWLKAGDYQAQFDGIVAVAETLAKRRNPLARDVLWLRDQVTTVRAKLREADALLSGDRDDIRGRQREVWRRLLEQEMERAGSDERYLNILKVATGSLWGTGGAWPWDAGYTVKREDDE